MKPRATASTLLSFVLLATLTVLVVIDFPGVASVQPMFRGGNGEETAAAAAALMTSSSSSSSIHDLVNPTTTDAPEDEDTWCRFCFEDISGMGEDHIVRCTHQARHPTCMRCYAKSHLIYKFDPRKCYGCNNANPDASTIDVAALTAEQKAVYAQCQAELGLGGEGETEDEERSRREEEEEEERRGARQERRRAYEDSQTPFMRALENRNLNEAQRLIRQGEVGDVNAVDLNGKSTLMWAIDHGGREVAQQLLDYSIRTEQPIAVNYVHQQLGVSTLMVAIDAGREVAQQLLDYSIQTNQPIAVTYVDQQEGESTLMVAIKHAGREAIIQQLLDYSIQTNQPIDVNYVNQRTGESTFESALRLALRRAPTGNPEETLNIVRLLIHHPSFDVNRPLNERGETALMLALSVEYARADVVRELLDLPGIDFNQKNNAGKTIEQYALESSNNEIRKLLGVRELASNTWIPRLHETLGGWGYGPSGI